jgi:hypothetical protein
MSVRSGAAHVSWTGRAMKSERGVNDLAVNQIVVRRGFSYLGALALNCSGPSAPNPDSGARQSQRKYPRSTSGCPACL